MRVIWNAKRFWGLNISGQGSFWTLRHFCLLDLWFWDLLINRTLIPLNFNSFLQINLKKILESSRKVKILLDFQYGSAKGEETFHHQFERKKIGKRERFLSRN